MLILKISFTIYIIPPEKAEALYMFLLVIGILYPEEHTIYLIKNSLFIY
jgi:hypothetical protein